MQQCWGSMAEAEAGNWCVYTAASKEDACQHGRQAWIALGRTFSSHLRAAELPPQLRAPPRPA